MDYPLFEAFDEKINLPQFDKFFLQILFFFTIFLTFLTIFPVPVGLHKLQAPHFFRPPLTVLQVLAVLLKSQSQIRKSSKTQSYFFGPYVIYFP